MALPGDYPEAATYKAKMAAAVQAEKDHGVQSDEAIAARQAAMDYFTASILPKIKTDIPSLVR